MSAILNFIINNYIWFLVISGILIFALIGYLVDVKKDERFSQKIEIDKELETRQDATNATGVKINEVVTAPVAPVDTNLPQTTTGEDLGIASLAKAPLNNHTEISDIDASKEETPSPAAVQNQEGKGN